MPVYTWTAQEGTFSEDQKKALAKIVTETHWRATGAPRNLVRVVFNTYPAGSSFVNETPSAGVFLLCQIRKGRPMESKQWIMKQLNDAAAMIGGISGDAITIIIEEIPSGHGMEFGVILAEATG
jgi:phenylpyruvate tautomerase PptA (4-oxalocrotonate tautomerase family)